MKTNLAKDDNFSPLTVDKILEIRFLNNVIAPKTRTTKHAKIMPDAGPKISPMLTFN